VFRYPQNEALNYIKRVVAVPGDKIRVKGNQILLNGAPQDLTYVDKYESMDDSCSTTPTKRYREQLSGLDHQILMNAGMPGSLATWPATGRRRPSPRATCS
jgi:signal peptidase I